MHFCQFYFYIFYFIKNTKLELNLGTSLETRMKTTFMGEYEVWNDVLCEMSLL